MKTYVVLLRGINVGGKNRVPMSELKTCLLEQGLENVTTLLQSGNVILNSKLSASSITDKIEETLPKVFALENDSIRVLVLERKDFESIIAKKPKDFGNEPNKYYSDVIFLMGIKSDDAMSVFAPREGVDKVWPGELAIYSQRLGAERTKSRLSKIVGTLPYKSMTIRSWSTTMKLLKALNER